MPTDVPPDGVEIAQCSALRFDVSLLALDLGTRPGGLVGYVAPMQVAEISVETEQGEVQRFSTDAEGVFDVDAPVGRFRIRCKASGKEIVTAWLELDGTAFRMVGSESR